MTFPEPTTKHSTRNLQQIKYDKGVQEGAGHCFIEGTPAGTIYNARKGPAPDWSGTGGDPPSCRCHMARRYSLLGESYILCSVGLDFICL